MSAYGIISDFASANKLSKDTILLKPKNQYINTELNDNRLNQLYSFYCGLLVEQYAADNIGSGIVAESLSSEVEERRLMRKKEFALNVK